MTIKNKNINFFCGHRILITVILCLFGLSLAYSGMAPKKKKRAKTSERVYLEHADELRYDQFGDNPTAQILVGKVAFKHKGARLTCDSAYFYQESNSFKAFGRVKMVQGDTLSLNSDYAFYDGDNQMAEARHNVVLRHRKTKLYTDSLNYDRLYGIGYFFEGGKMVDKDNVLVSDWGEYDTESRQAVFNYAVQLKNPKFLIDTDTLYYDTNTKLAHVVGPSKITSGASVINTDDGYYNTNQEQAILYGRSTMTNEGKEMTADSLFYNDKDGIGEGFGNVIYKDSDNKNELNSDYFWYNDKTGYGYATQRAVMKEFSQKDTLYMHADSIKLYTFNIDTDSVFREVHCFNKVRAFRTDVQAVCDSLVYNSKDSCMTMYKDPIVWNGNRQQLGEVIKVYMKDSTIHRAHVINQALAIEEMPDKIHYNQISSRDMFAYFDKGELRKVEAVANVLVKFYPMEEKDSSLMMLVNIETDTLRMFMKNRQLDYIWTPRSRSRALPMTQIPPAEYKLPSFAWFDYVRPLSKDDIFEWRGKKSGTELKSIKRYSAPLQQIDKGKIITVNVGEEDMGAVPVEAEEQHTTEALPPSGIEDEAPVSSEPAAAAPIDETKAVVQ